MPRAERDMIVVIRQGATLTDEAFEQKVQALSRILQATETIENFTRSHELVDRNRITRKAFRIREMIRYAELPAFRFFIGLN